MAKVVDGLLYSKSHEWVKVEKGVAVIGVTDYAQQEMGDVTYVDIPNAGDEVVKDEECGAVESVKASSEIYSPVSGTVIETNLALESSPEQINEDAYSAWIMRVEMSDTSDLDDLMDAAAYEALTAE